jgi:bacterioferritin-associated ferredoxin
MYVCVCNAVTDQEVTAAIREGATTVNEVTSRCSAGGDCGSCHEMIENMIEEHGDRSGPQLIECAKLTKRTRAA